MDYQLELEEADVDSLSQCEASTQALQQWLESLPLANVGESARRVYVATQELAALNVAPALRIELLDTLRETIYYLCESMAKHYLNQPPLLKDKQAKVATLCNALQGTLASGFMLSAVQLLEQRATTERNQQIARAIHRAISDLARILLRAYQIYVDAPPRLWLHTHQLYRMAEDLQLTGTRIEDLQNREARQTSIEDAYKRVLLMGCSRPSQIRQSMLATLYSCTEHWLDLFRISTDASYNDLYGVNLLEDLPPTYLTGNAMDHGEWRSLNLEALVEALASHIESVSDGGTIRTKSELVPASLALHVLDHLIATWSAKADRMEPRRPADEPVQVCVGMTAVHYFIAGQLDFDLQMSGGVSLSTDEKNPFLNRDMMVRVSRTASNPDSDAWGQATDAGHGGFGDIDISKLERVLGAAAVRKYKQEGIRKIADLADEVPTQPLHHPRMVNRSPAGCCLLWEEDPSDRLQDGQLVGVREPGEASWKLGRVCWIRSNEQKLQTGVRFVANNGIACGAAVSYKERDRIEFMRAIELPELASAGEPATLILPNVPFKPNIKIFLNRMGKTSKAMLGSARLVTSSFSMLEYRELDLAPPPGPNEPQRPAGPGKDASQQPGDTDSDPFGSIWGEL